MLVRIAGLRDRLMSVGSRPNDRPDDRLRKGSLVLISILVTILATAWTVTYLWLGQPLAAAIPLTYQVISIGGLVYVSRTSHFGPFQLSQLIAMLILPFALQWTLGGFVNSSAMMVWSFVSPLGALVLIGGRPALAFLGAYLALAVLSGLVDPWLSARAVPMPDEIRLLFFVLNISAVSFVTYAALHYFVAERERAMAETDALLHNILPMSIADRLKAGEGQIADDFGAVTVLFADVVGFTSIARSRPAREVVNVLERLFSAFDALADEHGLEKIKTIGDAYMAVAGAPEPRPDHARAAADMALGMVDATAKVAAELDCPIELRVGLHTGPANAGVVGRRKFFYDLWGDAVNVASRMESSGAPGRVQVSAAVEEALRGRYRFEDRGLIEIKGIGRMQAFFLAGPAA